MNTAQLKIISWSLAALFGAGLATYVGDYLMNRGELEKRVSAKEIQELMTKVAPVEKKAEDIVAYERVNQALHRFNWTGKPPPPPPAPPKGPDIVKPGTEPVSSLLKILLIKADMTDDSGSRVVLKYLPPAKVSLKDPTVVKHVGDLLDPPNEWITVAAILPEGVRFRFANASREPELVVPDEFKNRLDMAFLAGPDSLQPQPEIRYERGPNSGQPPKKTTRINDDYFKIGTDDMLDWDENYGQYLSEIEHSKHRDPSTGKYDGIALTNVPANSVAAAHGAKEGDVIKSINGFPVNSVQEALAFVKQNKDKYDVWDVVVDSKGKLHTITYKVPKKK